MMRWIVVATFVFYSAASSAKNKDEEALKKLQGDYQAAFNANDPKAEVALYADDGDIIDPAGTVARGREEIEKLVTQEYATAFKGAKISITPTHTRMLKPDVAIIDGEYEITGARMADGNPMPMPMKGLYTVVTVKNKGKWWVSSLRPMIAQQAPSARTKAVPSKK